MNLQTDEALEDAILSCDVSKQKKHPCETMKMEDITYKITRVTQKKEEEMLKETESGFRPSPKMLENIDEVEERNHILNIKIVKLNGWGHNTETLE